MVRHALVPKDTLGGRWTILGQSFGGFCCLTYLSIAPQGAWRGGSRTLSCNNQPQASIHGL